MKTDEARKQCYIPNNYSTGINLLGFTFKTRNLLEGVVLGAIIGGLALLVIRQIKIIDIGTTIGLVISFALIGFIVGVAGINDEPISVFVKNKFDFSKKVRTAFFNPHTKDDTVPYFYEYQKEKDSLPREKIVAFYRKYKANIELAEQQRMEEFQKTNTFDETTMFFLDDEGRLDKPVEYMNQKEYKNYLKEIKKHKKKVLKEQKLQEKLAKKQDRGGLNG